MCVSTATASVLVNGSSSSEFNLEKGLRQGDSLSPFLYLIVAEGLNLLVNKAIEKGVFEALKVDNDKVVISHLQYADDTIFICSDAERNIKSIKYLLRIFKLLSGLKVNFHKSNLYGIHVDPVQLRNKTSQLGCEMGSGPIKYLGLKVGVNHRDSSA